MQVPFEECLLIPRQIAELDIVRFYMRLFDIYLSIVLKNSWPPTHTQFTFLKLQLQCVLACIFRYQPFTFINVDIFVPFCVEDNFSFQHYFAFLDSEGYFDILLGGIRWQIPINGHLLQILVPMVSLCLSTVLIIRLGWGFVHFLFLCIVWVTIRLWFTRH